MKLQRLIRLGSLKLIMLLVFYSCTSKNNNEQKKEENENTLFTLLSSEKTGVDFINKVENREDFNIFKYRNFYNGGGVAIGDINNDGLPDMYMTANMKKNKLYLNRGDFVFEDISESAGVVGNKPWSTGVNMIDINNDGLLDIYVSNAGNIDGGDQKNELFINNGNLTFTEKAEEYNLADSGFTTHAAFFDYDQDGDLDAYILNNSFLPVSSLGYSNKRELRSEDWDLPDLFKGGGDKLLRNDNGLFTDVSEEAGIYGSLIGFGMGVTIGDVNNDLLLDIYVSNDFYERDYLYINNGDGTFKEDIKNRMPHLSLSSMGADMADINNDGRPEIFVTDMLPENDERLKNTTDFERYDVYQLKKNRDFHNQYMQNTLQLNNGNDTFSEVAFYSGVAETDWSWGALIFDIDNDGYKDIYVCNGIYHDLTNQDFIDFFANEVYQGMVLSGVKTLQDSIINSMPSTKILNYAYKNNKDITFSNETISWGFGKPSWSNGAAYGDLDNDGDLDLVISNVNMEAFVYRNNTEKFSDNNFIKLKFEGSNNNKFAIGTSVKLYYEDKTIFQELVPSRGFQSSVDYIMTIGLGKNKLIDSLRVIWPDGNTQKLTTIEANQELVLKNANAKEKYYPVKRENRKTFIKELNNDLETHLENVYNDFDNEGLISKKLSQEGPAIAIGDVNGDGNEDIFIGGASGQKGKIYIHKGNGRVVDYNQKVFEEDATYEDTASVFFDADGDGDLDLMVGSGGNEVGKEKTYVSRLYINNGKGFFTKANLRLPSTFHNTSVISSYDFDKDGDMDVFVGSRSVVGTYGVDPKHLFLENNGDGTFSDATERLVYDLKDGGMITDAIWLDFDGDSKKDLVTVSDWGSPQVYKNSGKRLSKFSTSLDSLYGWWNIIEGADLDNDGDTDLIIGNRGNNSPHETSKKSPMKMWLNDFDNNGTIEQIVTRSFDGKDYPIHMRKELTAQMVFLKKQNLKASEYATKSVDELFSKEIFDNSIVKKTTISESVVAINEGEGNFTIKELPKRVQLSCVCGIACLDVNMDGNLDIVMGGNNFEFKPQYSRSDANFGNVLLNNGNLEFEWQDYDKSGFFIWNEIKHIKRFVDKNGNTYLITAINNDKPKIFSLQ